MPEKFIQFAPGSEEGASEMRAFKFVNKKFDPDASQESGSEGLNGLGTAEMLPIHDPLHPFPEITPTRLQIEDPDFMKALRRLRSLASFQSQVTAAASPVIRRAARLGGLNQLKSAFPSKGRAASFDEWQAVEIRTEILWSALSDIQRRKFLATQTPGWISYLISAFIVLAAAALLVALLLIEKNSRSYGGIFVPFLIWVIALGAIGGGASIGMNALAVQDDATYDISSGKFIWLRIVLGALFGTVLTLPLGLNTFTAFISHIGEFDGSAIDTTDALKQAGLLLMPFILGFSTSLVILVLNRLVESALTFFGKNTK